MSRVSKNVKVKDEVEKLVRELADKIGVEAFVIRNTAILLGLMQIAITRYFPYDDEEFLELQKRITEIVKTTPKEEIL